MKLPLILLGIILSASTYAQIKSTEQREMTWFGYFNQTRLTNKSGIWFDANYRLTDQFVKESHVALARLGYIYYLSDNARLSASYAYQNQLGHDGNPSLHEHRPFQQLQWFERKNWFSLMQWVRVEQRFRENVFKGTLTDSYTFNWRFRYNFSLTIPLTQKTVVPKAPFVFLNNEVFLNGGESIVNNYFDQNRSFAGLGYQFTKHVNAHFGYMYIFQQLPTVNNYVESHALRLFLFHNLDLRKQEML